MKSVYVINGFLESGKTEFITYTLAQPYFQIKGKTLLILCEEGEIEYEEELLTKSKTVVELIEEEEEFTAAHLLELEKKHKPDRIIIEYNGMWNFKEMKLPWHWKIDQQITTIDGSTFPMYFTNMRSLLAEMVRNSEMIIFNRCDGIEDLSSYKRNIKAINPKADIIFEDANGEITEIMEDDLPYDLKQDVIELDDIGYGIWYMDAMDNPDKYEGKIIKTKAVVYKPKEYSKVNAFIPGRFAMTCCADDIRYIGIKCFYDDNIAKQLSGYKDRDFINLVARAKVEFVKEYNDKGVVLYAEDISSAKKPEDDLVYFN